MKPNLLKKIVSILLIVAVGIFWILPFIGVVMVSFRPYSEVVNGWWHFEELHLSLENYGFILCETSLPFLRPLLNSLYTSVLGAVIPALLGSMTAYAFVRHKIPGKTALLVILLSLMAIPGQMIVIPAFRRLNALGFLDTHAGVILMNTVTCLPWMIFFMVNVMKGLDISIEEAARIDGASDYLTYGKMILPQCGPALASACILQFVWAWNTFFWPLILIFSPEKMLSTQVIPMLRVQFYTNCGALCAAVTLVMAVPIAIFLIFQKYYIQGSVGFVSEK